MSISIDELIDFDYSMLKQNNVGEKMSNELSLVSIKDTLTKCVILENKLNDLALQEEHLDNARIIIDTVEKYKSQECIQMAEELLGTSIEGLKKVLNNPNASQDYNFENVYKMIRELSHKCRQMHGNFRLYLDQRHIDEDTKIKAPNIKDNNTGEYWTFRDLMKTLDYVARYTPFEDAKQRPVDVIDKFGVFTAFNKILAKYKTKREKQGFYACCKVYLESMRKLLAYSVILFKKLDKTALNKKYEGTVFYK